MTNREHTRPETEHARLEHGPSHADGGAPGPDVTVPEAVLLLSLDDETGAARPSDTTLGLSMAGAALAQLALDGRLRSEGGDDTHPGRLVATPATTDPRLEPLVALVDGKRPSDAMSAITGWGGAKAPASRLRAELLDGFERDGVLARTERRFLGINWGDRWPRGERRDLEDAIQRRAHAVLDGGTDLILESALGILHAMEALPSIFPDVPRERLDRRGAELLEASWPSAEIARVMEVVYADTTSIIVPSVILPMILNN